MLRFFRFSIIFAACAILSGCALLPRHRLDEAAQAVPEIRTYVLEQLPDLSPIEREIIKTQSPAIRHANYMIYYFAWFDDDGDSLAVVETSPPPCEPYTVGYRISGPLRVMPPHYK